MMGYIGGEDGMPDFPTSPIDASDNFNTIEFIPDNNMDELLRQLVRRSPSYDFDQTQGPPAALEADSDQDTLQTLDIASTGNVSGQIDSLAGLGDSNIGAHSPSQSNDPSLYQFSQSTNPYSYSILNRLDTQTIADAIQSHPSSTGLNQGNIMSINSPQSESPSSYTSVWDPQKWTEMVKTRPYPPGLDPKSLAHRHFGIRSYHLPKHIDPTFMYHGQGYAKPGDHEDNGAEDLALSDEEQPISQSDRQGQYVNRSRNTQPDHTPTSRSGPRNPAVAQPTQSSQYPWAIPRQAIDTIPTESMAYPWDIPYQPGAYQTGILSVNPGQVKPNQVNSYELDESPLDMDSPAFWQPNIIPQDSRRTTVAVPTTTRRRRESRIAGPVQEDSFREDPARRDPRGKAKPVNRVGSNTNLTKNNRRADNQLARGTYDPLPSPPLSWTSSRGKEFTYDVSGELKNGTYYTVKEIEDFLYQNPRRATMTLWIQRLPADSAARYPYSESRRCRMLHCLMTNGTINQGHYRIAFDELTSTHAYHDPMHNAGYVHLYCIEKYFDFPKIVIDLNVQVDQRLLPMEPRRKNGLLYQTNNRMIVSTQGELNVATEFVDFCNENGRAPPGYPSYTTRNTIIPGRMGHEGTLVHRLWEMKIRHDGGTIRSAEKRGVKASTGVSHMGNLEIESRERGITRKKENQIQRKENPRPGGRRRINPATTVREERARKKRKVEPARSLHRNQGDDDDDEYVGGEDDEEDADVDNDSLFHV